MKAGNHDRVVLLAPGGTPWAIALGRDVKAEHEHGCHLLMDWLGIADQPVTVDDACCRPLASGREWGLAEPADPKAATVLVIHDAEAGAWRTKRHALHPRHFLSGEGVFYGASQDDDALVTAWDGESVALAAFRPTDRKLLKDVAEALQAGRLAIFDGGEIGPILVLADRVPGNAFCQSIAMVATSLSFDDEGSGIAYAEQPTRVLETCVEAWRAR